MPDDAVGDGVAAFVDGLTFGDEGCVVGALAVGTGDDAAEAVVMAGEAAEGTEELVARCG